MAAKAEVIGQSRSYFCFTGYVRNIVEVQTFF